MEKLTFARALMETEKALLPVAGPDARLEARELVAAAAGTDRRALMRLQSEDFPPEARDALRAMTRDRLSGRPLQYIVGAWDIMGLEFRVDSRALIPRQDTETLIEAALALIGERGHKSCLDMCCGTGCIGIALAVLGGVRVTLADISGDALSLARENAQMHGVEAEFIQTDLFESIARCYDIIVCNPPYLDAEAMTHLQKELAFEPENALYGGPDGLDFYRRLALEAPPRVAPGGVLLMETGAGQAAAVQKLFAPSRTVRDINGIERTVIWEKCS